MNPIYLLLSIHPKHADKMFRGKKTAELRRTRPRVAAGDILFIYVTNPTKALVGRCEVTDLISGSPTDVWETVGNQCCLSSDEYFDYFDGAEIAYAIMVKNPQYFSKTISLEALKYRLGSFSPPQIYQYLSHDEVSQVITFEEDNMKLNPPTASATSRSNTSLPNSLKLKQVLS
jgi:predicted transcriptional regulator